jgi:uncharacterized membrane protein
MSKFTTQFEYMEALRRALTGLPDDVAAATMADYQQRFLDGLSGGRNEAEIAYGLDEPIIVAARLRKSSDLAVFQQKKSVPNLVRLFFSALGLLVFNVFLIIPAFVYSMMLFALYVASVAVYAVGIAVTSSSLAGVNELAIDGPFRHVVMQKHESGKSHLDEMHGRLNLQFDSHGVRITPEAGFGDDDSGRSTVVIGPNDGFDEDSRTMGTVKGIGFILGGILMFLVSLVITRFTWIAIKRYAQMNYGLLRGN